MDVCLGGCLFIPEVLLLDGVVDDLCSCPGHHFHFQSFVLALDGEGVARNSQRLQILEVPRTDQVVLILYDVVRHVQSFQLQEISSLEFFSVDASELIPGHVAMPEVFQASQNLPILTGVIVRVDEVGGEVERLEGRESLESHRQGSDVIGR